MNLVFLRVGILEKKIVENIEDLIDFSVAHLFLRTHTLNVVTDTAKSNINIKMEIFNKPGVARAVLQTPS